MKLRFHNHFIYVGVDISIYALLTGDGINTSLSRLVLYPRVVYSVAFFVLPAARSCAAWDDNNKDNVCTPSIPAGLKCPPPSKTISSIIRFGTILNTLSVRIPRRPTGRSSVFTTWNPVRKCFFYIRWRIGRSKVEELRLPPRSEEKIIPPRSEEKIIPPRSEEMRIPPRSEASPLKEELD